MLNRRLIVLFIFFGLAIIAIGIRLARLQLVEADYWREQMRQFVHRHRLIETYRGSILDRNGKILAQDVACNDLAIDYRAMNLDDRWLTRMAQQRIKAAGEKFAGRSEYQQRVGEVKEELAARIDAMPAEIARQCNISLEDVHQRINDVRSRIQALHQDLWSPKFDKSKPMTDEELEADYKGDELREDRIPHTIVPNVSNEVANYFDVHGADFPGLYVQRDSTRRFYPYNDVACHVIGTLRSVDDETLKEREQKFEMSNLLAEDDAGNLRGYLPADLMGETGVEKLMETKLRGTRGARLVELGQKISDASKKIDPVPGGDVKLTLDIDLQKELHQAIGDPARGLLKGDDGKSHFVAMVVMSMDGQVLAMVSWPTYDLNTIDSQRVALNNDTFGRPLLNRTLLAYPPGSTVKPLLATAGLSEGVITREEQIVCRGYLFPNQPGKFHCLEVHGAISVVDAIAQSCNVFFYTVGGRLKIDGEAKWYGSYGLGRDTGFELPESLGSIANPVNYKEQDTAMAESLFEGIGQGKVTATPLQMATAYATMLRGGVYVAPHLLADTNEKQAQGVEITPQTLAIVREGMEKCVSSGTARSVFKGMRLAVGGKTGTAETPFRPVFDDNGKPVDDPSKPILNADGTPKIGPDGKPLFKQLVSRGDDAWFIGYAPADQPQFVVAAVMEWGGHGGRAAAPMVREAFLQLEKHHYLPQVDGQ